MRSRLMFCLAIGAGVLLLSGCSWLFRGVSFSKSTVSAGDKSVATIKTAAALDGKVYPFFLVGDNGNGTFKVVNPKTFDTGGKYNGPKDLVPDQALANVIVDNNKCPGVTDATAQIDTWSAYRTENTVKSNDTLDNPGPDATSKLGFKAKGSADTTSTPIAIASGHWVDDGDHTPENNDDTIVCSVGGGSVSWLDVK